MLLLDYANQKGILKTRCAKLVEVRDNGAELTILYKIEGQRYANNTPSARTLPRERASSIEIADDGTIMSGVIQKKNNFWIWSEDSLSDEA